LNKIRRSISEPWSFQFRENFTINSPSSPSLPVA
jgi:hypothetical protein